MKWLEINPDERVLIKGRGNNYKIGYPDRVWIGPFSQVLTKFSVGVRSERFRFDNVATANNALINVTVQVLYRVDPDLLNPGTLHLIPGLNDGGWAGILRWRAESVFRRVLGRHQWLDVTRPKTDADETEIETKLRQKLAGYTERVGLQIVGVSFIKTDLPTETLELQWRTEMIKTYRDLFNGNMQQALPFIKWELTNTLQRNGGSHLMMSNSDPFSTASEPGKDSPHYLINLPVPPAQKTGIGARK